MSFCPQRSERVSLLSFHHGTSLSNLCLSAMVERQIIKTRPLPSPMEEEKVNGKEGSQGQPKVGSNVSPLASPSLLLLLL